MGRVRIRLLVIVAVVALAAAVSVVAVAAGSADGLPAYTNGYAKWPRINKKPFTSTGPLSNAHSGGGATRSPGTSCAGRSSTVPRSRR